MSDHGAVLKVAFAAVLAAACAFSQAEPTGPPMDAFGLTLGKPLSLPLCPDGRAMRDGPCLADTLRGHHTLPASGQIVYPIMAAPQFTRGGGLGFRQDAAGNLALLVASTDGSSSQQAIFDALLAKYGAPSKSGTVPVQNRLGATFEAIVAEWTSPQIVVRFTGMTSVTSGELVIGTPEAVATREADIHKILNAGPRL